jgi:putative flippase GtrA
VAVAVHYAIMYVALAAGLSPLGSSSLGFAGGAFIRFIAAYFHIFDPLDSVPIAATRFSIALAAQFFGNAALLGLLVALGLDVWPAQVLTTISMTVLNYLVYRFWVFT